jgi:hypothetical protein
MGRGLFQILLITLMVMGLVTAMPEATIAGDQQISLATLVERLHQQAPQKIPVFRFLASKSCSKD